MQLDNVDAAVEHFKQIIELRKEGLAANDIAERLGCSTAEVNNAVSRMKARGIAVPKSQSKIKNEALDRLAEMCA